MKRSPNPDRVRQLVASATRLFIAQGYRRTQIADVAEDLGIAKGSVYLYVESKEALFDLTLRWADRVPESLPALLPIPTPQPGATLALVQSALAERAQFPALIGALNAKSRLNVRQEVVSIAEELHDVMARNRTGLKLIDRCAQDFPQLGDLWFQAGREGLLGLLSRYLELRAAHLRPMEDVKITARMVIETIVLWTVHRHWDTHPQAMDEQIARQTALDFVVNGLLPDQSS